MRDRINDVSCAGVQGTTLLLRPLKGGECIVHWSAPDSTLHKNWLTNGDTFSKADSFGKDKNKELYKLTKSTAWLTWQMV